MADAEVETVIVVEASDPETAVTSTPEASDLASPSGAHKQVRQNGEGSRADPQPHEPSLPPTRHLLRSDARSLGSLPAGGESNPSRGPTTSVHGTPGGSRGSHRGIQRCPFHCSLRGGR